MTVTDAPRARARADDPWTSWAAARGIGDLRPRLAAILHAYSVGGPMIAEELCAYYAARTDDRVAVPYPRQTFQSIRSRSAELADLGHISPTGEYRDTVNGHRSRVMRLTEASPPVPPQAETLF